LVHATAIALWQADITHWQLAGQRHVEILNMLDDHSRLLIASRAQPTTKASDVVVAFRDAIAQHGPPASLLCANGAVFTSTPRGGRVLLQVEMERLGVIAKHSRPYHPQTWEGRAPAPDAEALSGKAGTRASAR
jgi:transposase InsO family protein